MRDNDKKEEEKGFVIRDKRFSSQKEKEEEPTPNVEEKGEELRKTDTIQHDAPLPEIDFANFIHSLFISALIQLGEVPEPVTKQTAKDLALAKQTIDLIGMLQDKTRGNLTQEEGKLIEDILYNLRIIYIKATK